MIVGPFMVLIYVLLILSVAIFLKIITFINKFSFFVSSARTCNSFKAHMGTKLNHAFFYRQSWPQLFKSWIVLLYMINHYPVYKCCGNYLHYPVDCDLSGE